MGFIGIILGGIIGILIWIGIVALVIFICYRLLVSAIRAGILEADAERARRAAGLPPRAWNTFRGSAEEPTAS